LYWLETHKAVFRWVLKILDQEGLVSGRTVSIDATTLEANAALKSIVRRDNGQSYNDYLKELAKAAGMENPTREQLARLDRKRKKKGSNQEWMSPSDPDARITKMKDGRTHLAHKAEHAVDLTSGALLALTLQPQQTGSTDRLVNHAACLVCFELAIQALQQPPAQAFASLEEALLQFRQLIFRKVDHTADRGAFGCRVCRRSGRGIPANVQILLNTCYQIAGLDRFRQIAIAAGLPRPGFIT
jgi:hypothetical protein